MGKAKMTLWDMFYLVFYLALIYLLVKPSSHGPAFILGSTNALAAIINYSTSG